MKLRKSGLKIGKREIREKDVIAFYYDDKFEEKGYGVCQGVVEFKRGRFVVEEIGYKYDEEKPDTLYQWLTDEQCIYVGNLNYKKLSLIQSIR